MIGITSQTGLLIFYWFICRIILYNGVIMPFLADKMKKITSILTLFVLMVVSIFATAIHVPIDYSVIQERIGTKNTTDTFLFSNGTEYFHEMESENESSEKIRFTLGEVKLFQHKSTQNWIIQKKVVFPNWECQNYLFFLLSIRSILIRNMKLNFL